MPKREPSADLLKDLNPEQAQAVTHTAGPLLIVAGAGTGKTTVITRRIAWLIEQKLAKPEEILALTFTDKAATEMEERVDLLLPTGYVNVWVSTFHAFGERVLKDWGLEIGLPNEIKLLSQTEQWMLVRNNLERFELDYYRPLGNPTKFIHALLQHFARAKDEEVGVDDYVAFAEHSRLDTGATEYLRKGKATRVKKSHGTPVAASGAQNGASAEGESVRLEEVAKAYHTYQRLLLEKGALDFGDLIVYTLKLFRTRPRALEHFRRQFKYILVDEFQDTNYAQYELVKLLGAPGNNITVVGDDDQSIYKFRGASISNILEFKADYPKTKEVLLTTNYRSLQNILDLAYDFIQLNNPYRLEIKLAETGSRLSKKLTAARRGKGQIEYLAFQTGQDEAEGVVRKIVELKEAHQASWRDFAILVRANASAQPFIQSLRRYQLPFDYVASRGLYNEQIVLDVLAYLKLLDNYHESEALYRVLNIEPFIIAHEDLSKLLQYAARKTVSLYEAVQAARVIPLSQDGLRVVEHLLASIAKHAACARERSATEVFVTVVEDLGLAKRLADVARSREAQYLTSFLDRIHKFETDTAEKSLNSFLKFLELELEAGEEGRLPQNIEEGPDTVKVITVHSAKGLEWRFVFLVQLIDRRFPSTERREPIELPRELVKEVLPEGDVHLQEERRLFYVALTRARDGLYLTRANDYLGKTTRRPSRFLYELGLVRQDKVNEPAPTGRVRLNLPKPLKLRPKFQVPESFSFSSVSTFRKCPLEFKYRYLLRLPTPGSAALSFGSTMHRTFEQFLRLVNARQGAVQAGLFGEKVQSQSAKLPTEHELKELFEQAWVDDWYESKAQKAEYKTVRGPKQLKHFYQACIRSLPRPKYLEKMFKIGLGKYKFTGKIDRLDEAPGGVAIIDYKTGGEPRGGLEKVDKDQLIIYQIAAEEFLREHVIDARYWYLEPNQLSEAFVATAEQVKQLKQEYSGLIDEIVQTIENDSFVEADELARKHECKYRNLV